MELENTDPFQLFAEWMALAAEKEPNDPNAMALATADSHGAPSVRMVLLKDAGPDGFVFYTNLESRKGRQITENPNAALLFHWKSLRRQIRLEGPLTAVTAAEADAYFASRPRQSRLGAWASDQSRPLESRFALEKRIAAVLARFPVGPVPRPPQWSGFRLTPLRIEFWQDREFRLHDRFLFSRPAVTTPGWQTARLYP